MRMSMEPSEKQDGLPTNQVKEPRKINPPPAKYRFQKGISGNPKGRPKGSKNRMSVLAEGLIGDNAKKIVKKVIDMALLGNEACLKMCMDRILPASRAIDSLARERQGQGINIIIESADKSVNVTNQVYSPLPLGEDTEGEE